MSDLDTQRNKFDQNTIFSLSDFLDSAGWTLKRERRGKKMHYLAVVMRTSFHFVFHCRTNLHIFLLDYWHQVKMKKTFF